MIDQVPHVASALGRRTSLPVRTAPEHVLRFCRISAMWALGLALAACDARRTITGEEALHGLTVRVQLAPELTALSQALAWPPHGVPGARVVMEREGSEQGEPLAAATAVSDVQGLAHFTRLKRARYVLRVERSFSAAERVQAGNALAGVDALVGAVGVTLIGATSDTFRIALKSSGGSSLVFSEIAPAWPAASTGDQYYYGGYFEIANNSDTVVALAGKLWFDAYGGYIRSPVVPDGCNYFLPLERDARGVWTRWIYRFPPDARPITPGEVVILATDAIDHRLFGLAGLRDLSRADFEFLGPADIDNPLVPNMIDLSPRAYSEGHGWRFRGGRQVWGLAVALGVDTLPRYVDHAFGRDTWLRVPVSALLDIVRYNWDMPSSNPSIVDCPSPIMSDVDAADAVLLKIQDTLAIHRRVSRTLPDGRVVYQRSRNSAADWITGPGTPGKVP